jgi:hypothetical protein
MRLAPWHAPIFAGRDEFVVSLNGDAILAPL